jgi:hypothetical protein
MHEPAVWTVEIWDTIEDITPEIEIISLVNNSVILADGKFSASENGRAGKSLEHHGHFPIKKNLVGILGDGLNFHVQLLTTVGQPFT